MPDDLTREQTARLLTWVGVWKPDERCPVIANACSWCEHDDCPVCHPHDIPMPALTGDFADVVAMKCLAKLAERGEPELQYVRYDCLGWFLHVDGGPSTDNGLFQNTPTDAIFAATLAYLKEQEGK